MANRKEQLELFKTIWTIANDLRGAVDGWTFIVCSIWLVSGIQMLSIGIIGEYVGKIYSETKRRPRYFIAENLEESTNENIDK